MLPFNLKGFDKRFSFKQKFAKHHSNALLINEDKTIYPIYESVKAKTSAI